MDPIEWLMQGDPAIRWQVMRDLLDCPEPEYQAERQKIATESWGGQFLSALDETGNWPKGRWTDTVWTLLQLMDLGFPPDHPQVRQAAHGFIDRNLTGKDEKWLLERMDLCHLGFWLRIAAYFGADPGILTDTILKTQLEDGGWNCRIRNYPKTIHSSFHTTFNILEGLRLANPPGFREAEGRALEFMLAHQMYRSDKTGEVIDERFTALTFPSHWHYNVLRGLDYMRLAPEIRDGRLADPIALLESRRKPNGRWPVEKRIPGVTLFDMEKLGGDSRWNTLRALRVVRARGA